MRLDGDQTLKKIIEIVVQVVSPVQVILFGSRVSGHAREDSDYDLLIIQDSATNERLTSRKIQRALLDNGIDVPVDVIVVNRAKFASHRHNRGTVYHWGEVHGEVVHG